MAFVHEETHGFCIRPGRMLACLIKILISDGISALRPICSHQNPRSAGNAAVLLLPLTQEVDRKQEIGIGSRLPRAIEHAGWRDELCGGDRISAAVGQMPARDPMYRSIEMRTCMLAAREIVPIPARPTLVIARRFF